MARILLVDDEGNMLKVLGSLLQIVGRHEVVCTSDGVEAAQFLRAQDFDLMITDIRMSPMNGMQLLRLSHELRPNTVVILVTAFSSIETAIEAHDLGAFDYVPKPFKVDELLETVTMAIKYREERLESAGCAEAVARVEYYMDDIVAKSSSMRAVCDLVKRLAPADMPVMIAGPKGSGRQTIARAIHNHSNRKDRNFASLHCKELSPIAIEAEMFRDGGALENCSGGTLLLEEIDGLSPTIQTKLSEVMKDKKFRVAGTYRDVTADFRLVGSTALRPDEAARKGLFLADVRRAPSRITIEIAPLRERAEDVVPLASHFIKKLAPAGPLPALSPQVCAVLASYSWPENADQLAAAVKSMLPMARDGALNLDAMPVEIRAAVKNVRGAASIFREDMRKGKNLMKFIRRKRREQLSKVVDESGGDRRKAAKALNISLVDLNRELDEPEAS